MTVHTNEHVKKTIHDFFKQTEKTAEDNTDLFDSDIMDSMDIIMLLSFIEENLDIDIPQEIMTRDNFSTITNIIKTIERVGS